MYRGFWAWRGANIKANDSLWLYFILFGATIIGLLIAWVYKKQIYHHYKNIKQIAWMPKRTFEIVAGITIINFMLIRIVLLELDDAPFKWEYIPFHFCRMFILVAALMLIFKKVSWVKYLGIFAILGGIIGMIFSDIKNSPEMMKIDELYNSIRSPINLQNLGKNLGYDNYHWWDFVFAHCFVIIIYVMFYIVSGKEGKITKKSFVYSNLTLAIFSVIIFFLNWIIDSLNVGVAWNPNWFFMGRAGIKTLGVLTRWPYALFSLVSLGFIAVALVTGIYMAQDKVKFVFHNGFVNKVKLQKSKNWAHFKSSKLGKNK